MTRYAFDMPSRATFKWLGDPSLLASLFCFSSLAADSNCGARSWDGATYLGIAIVAVPAGIALGLLLTAAIIVLGWSILLVRPLAITPEPRQRAGRVSLTLLLLHLLTFYALDIIGILPMGWIWWLGALGATGMHPADTTYLLIPSN